MKRDYYLGLGTLRVVNRLYLQSAATYNHPLDEYHNTSKYSKIDNINPSGTEMDHRSAVFTSPFGNLTPKRALPNGVIC